MNKNKYGRVLLFVLVASSGINLTVQGEPGYWQLLKNRVGSLWSNYKRRNAPRPRLVSHRVIYLGEEGFEEFGYELSDDNDIVRMLRRKLHVSGVYIANDSSIEAYRTYLSRNSMLEEYLENGFDIGLDNTISACMLRLFGQMGSPLMAFDTSSIEDAYAQIFWELEKSLPRDFDVDNNGQKFIDVIRRMLPKEDATAQRDYFIGYHLGLWKDYTLRFSNSKGLMKAIERYPQLKMFF